MTRFVEDPGLARSMGARARAIAEHYYSVDRVNDILLATMKLSDMPTPLETSPVARAAEAMAR